MASSRSALGRPHQMAGKVEDWRQSQRRKCHFLGTPRATATRGWRRDEWAVAVIFGIGDLSAFLLLLLLLLLLLWLVLLWFISIVVIGVAAPTVAVVGVAAVGLGVDV